jgi:hypothetical protein
MMKMSNKAATAEELVFHREYSLDDYAEARQQALYLPDYDAMLLYDKVTNLGVYYKLPCDCTLKNYSNWYIEKKYGKMLCETFISYLARTRSKIVGFVTFQGDVEVDEEGFMTMMFEAGKTYPPDDALVCEWVSDGAICDMDTREAIQNLNEQKVKAIIQPPPEKQRRM